jgi:deoxyribodipyrimidine photo-lyase
MAFSEDAISSRTAPAIRIRNCNLAPVRGFGSYMLYWMIANRRLTYNFALDRALEYCRELRKPLVILEPLRCGYQWASDRFHRFVIDGMAENADACARHRIRYYPYVEPTPGGGKGLLEAFAEEACVVITDEFPCFFLPRMVAAAARRLPVRLEVVDSNGLLPLRAADKAFVRAFDFRRHLQTVLHAHLATFPAADPLCACDLPAALALPSSITSRWPPASAALLAAKPGSLDALPIDHAVKLAAMTGGHTAAWTRLKGSSEISSRNIARTTIAPRSTLPAVFPLTFISATFPLIRYLPKSRNSKIGGRKNYLSDAMAPARAGGI